MIEKARSFAEQEGTYFTNQLYNADSIVGYSKIGKELLRQIDHKIDAYCGAVGTAGMLMGVAQELKRAYPKVMITALEPATSAVISGGEPGPHRVEGIGIGFIAPLLDEKLYDASRGIDEAESREMARRLASQEGIFAGTSTGLNVVGALQVAQELGEGKTVVTVAVDTGLKYLAGDLYKV
jgi:cysteine synthase